VSDELAFTSALELARMVREREVTPVELVELYLDRIERLDLQLNSYVTVDAEGALAAAHEPRDGPFGGVPISIKDLSETAGLRTTYSTKAFAENVPEFDAGVVRRIRDAGFVVLGKTNTPEFGTIAMTESELNGACRNPWDLSRTPGGSSGGAGAATAAALCPVAHGTDGGGSIRIPASCCGLVGLKPSRGRVSPAPYGSGSLGLGTSGPIARTVRDAAALLDVMTGAEAGDFFVAPEPERPFLAEADLEPHRLRIAVTTEPPTEAAIDPACAQAASDAAALLGELGHEVVEATPPWRSDDMIVQFDRVWQVGPATAGVDDLTLLEPINRVLAEKAMEIVSTEHAIAIMSLQRLVRRIVAFWSDIDVVVTPTLALPPVPIGWTYEDTGGDPSVAFARQRLFTPFTALVNVTGQPAMSLPLHWSDEGLPIGVQFIGKPFAEATLIRLAAQLERARPWSERRPPVGVATDDAGIALAKLIDWRGHAHPRE
jgi:amidase